MRKTWIVVADQSHARIYEAAKPLGPLAEIERLEHAVGSKRGGEILSDRPGRAFDSVGGGRHAMEPEVDAKEVEAMRFAKKIVTRLEKGRTSDRFDRLILVAGPHFLGLLRQALGPGLADLVSAAIAKNLGQYDAREIRAHLPERL
jgi:protein required for attachment to host cells